MRRRPGEANQRFAERRQREDEAPRLATAVPNLVALKLQVKENRGSMENSEATHIRRIVVDNAPALFVLSCQDSQCRDGGHDVTYEVMRALRARESEFAGQNDCPGSVGSAPCHRSISYIGTAEYSD